MVETTRELQIKNIYIKRELLRRRAQSSLLEFIKLTKTDYEVNWHHELTAKYLTDFAFGKIKRLMIFEPPRHGKSEQVSRRLPAFIHGVNPDKAIISATYTQPLAESMNRDVQRIIDSPTYVDIFPETKLFGSNIRTVANGTWVRNSDVFEIVGKRGVYRCAGVGGALTGFGMNIGIIDDPIKNQEEADSQLIRDRLWEWYGSVFYTRLEKDAQILLTMCMTGDTLVLMANGTETQLRNIKVGDSIATYEDGKLAVSTVKNWKCQGPDLIFAIRMDSGTTVKANERHPFLVCKNGEMRWVRLRDLRVNDKLIRVGDHYEVSHVHSKGVENRQNLNGFVCPITIRPDGQQACDPHLSMQNHAEQCDLDNDMGLNQKSITQCLSSKTENAPYVKSRRQQKMYEHTGITSSALITTISPERFEDFCATTVISPLVMENPIKSFSQPLNTYEITLDSIVEIYEAGKENVFDIQVDRTENFIANGLVSHNTRWHEDDLAGRLLTQAKADGNREGWVVLSLPAICEPVRKHDKDPRKEGEALWKNKFDETSLEAFKRNLGSRGFASLYQQRPTQLEGGIIKREWIKTFIHPPKHADRIITSWDAAFKGGPTSSYVVGQVWSARGADRHLLYQIRKRMDFPETLRAIREVSAMFPKAEAHIIEDKANGPAIISTLQKEISGILPIKPDASKESRLSAVSAQFEAGNVYVPDPSLHNWVEDYIEELCTAPNGTYWDQCDSTSQALDHLRSAGGVGGLWIVRR